MPAHAVLHLRSHAGRAGVVQRQRLTMALGGVRRAGPLRPVPPRARPAGTSASFSLNMSEQVGQARITRGRPIFSQSRAKASRTSLEQVLAPGPGRGGAATPQHQPDTAVKPAHEMRVGPLHVGRGRRSQLASWEEDMGARVVPGLVAAPARLVPPLLDSMSRRANSCMAGGM